MGTGEPLDDCATTIILIDETLAEDCDHNAQMFGPLFDAVHRS